MRKRANFLIYCSLGNLVASLLELLVLAQDWFFLIPLALAGAVPSLFCLFSGYAKLNSVSKILVAGCIGWMLGFYLATPTRVRSTEDLAASWTGGNDDLIFPTIFFSVTFVLVTACFIKLVERPTRD